jgi:hypothetical protein
MELLALHLIIAQKMKKVHSLNSNGFKQSISLFLPIKKITFIVVSLAYSYASMASVMIFELYADSRRAGAIYSDDYMVLFNSGPASQSLDGWSVQFAPSGTDTWAKFNLPNFTMPPSTYFLIRIPVFGSNQPNTAPISNPDFTTPIFRFNGLDNSGKLVLMSNNSILPGGVFDPNGLSDLVDFVGYGNVDFTEQNNGAAPSPAPDGPIWRYLRNDTQNNSIDFQFEPEPLNGAFPLNLVAFKGIQIGNEIGLNWETTNELNNLGFQIERSFDASSFEIIGFFGSKKDTQTVLKYQFSDTHPFKGVNYYRIKQIDLDGNFNYSKMIVISIKNDYSVLVYPNPAKDKLFLEIEFAKKIDEAFFLDMNGKMIRLIIDREKNLIDLSGINSENLIVWFKTKAGEIKTMKIKRYQ